MDSKSPPIRKNNPEEIEEQMKPIILKFMMEFQEQNKTWRKTFQEENKKWEMVVRERDLEIKKLQENSKSKDQILKDLQERCAIRIGRNPKIEAKPREGLVTSGYVKVIEQSGEKKKEELEIIKPDKQANVKVRKKEG